MKDDGGSAFPTPEVGVGTSAGMSLRDYFAGQALASLAEKSLTCGWEPESLAATCYRAADAMLAEREKGGAHASDT